MQGFPEPDLARKLDKGKGKKACTVVMTASERKVRETESWVESGGKSLSTHFLSGTFRIRIVHTECRVERLALRHVRRYNHLKDYHS
jgi:hypothetical protein